MKLKIAIILILASVLLAGCVSKQPAEVQPTTTVQPSKVIETVTLNGAGATFPYPLISKWSSEYNKINPKAQINYQSVGSGAGIKQITARTVDFGASDAPLSDQEYAGVSGLLQIPESIGAVVVAYNLPGIQKGVKLSGDVISDIFLGKIKKWNDPALVALNPSLKNIDANITVVRRADSSGTTFLFTNYLSKVSADWKTKVGADTTVAWPEGVAGKGNAGVASYVQRIHGSIGYVEYAYAKQSKLAYTQLQNRDGLFVMPDDTTFQAAAANADWAKAQSFGEILTYQPGKTSWPITGAVFVLMQKKALKPAQSKEVFNFFEWSFKRGAKDAKTLDYVPMPANVVKLIQTSWKGGVVNSTGKSVW